ncbi:hypothetical protein ZWY2020_003626 [Hordeum vulgare]
MAHLL